MKERWKTIDDYPRYQISNTGKVRVKDTKSLISSFDNGVGYHQVILRDENGYKHYLIHRLVAQYFKKGFAESLYVCFKDGNKTNFDPKNLIITNDLANTADNFFGNPRKPVIQYSLEGKKLNTFSSLRDAAKTVTHNYRSTTQISKVCKGTAKTAYGFKWEYETT